MKPTEPFSEEIPPDNSPLPSFAALLVFILIIVLAWLCTSCAQLQSIPFSVSYTDEEGETFTITKLAVPIPIHPQK